MARGSVQRRLLDSAALSGNPAKEPSKRRVAVYLPPSYTGSGERRYPAVYLLHGIGDSEESWLKTWTDMIGQSPFTTIPDLMDIGIAQKRFGEMIIVMPDVSTSFGGSFGVASSATGDWDRFLAKELPSLIDSEFRTEPRPDRRAIAGFSMGAHAAIQVAMRHPDVFGAFYAMSPLALTLDSDLAQNSVEANLALTVKDEAGFAGKGPRVPLWIALGQAFAPDTERPPFYAAISNLDSEKLPLATAGNYQGNLLQLHCIVLDAGMEDEFPHVVEGARRFSKKLTAMGVVHRFELHNGKHRDRLWGRSGRLFVDLLPALWFAMDTRK